MSDADSATREIPEYPALRCPEDWAQFLRISKSMLERATIRQEMPSDEEFQAVAHLVHTLAARHFRRLH